MRIVAGKFRGKALLSPSDDSIRPTSDRARESVFNILSSRIGVHPQHEFLIIAPVGGQSQGAN